MPGEKKFDLQNRLIDFAVLIIQIAQKFPNSDIGRHIKSQIIRSGTSPAANYGEAKSAESRPDFIHKLKLALKELRETKVWLLITQRTILSEHKDTLREALRENEELISIVFKSIDTARKNLTKSKLKSNKI